MFFRQMPRFLLAAFLLSAAAPVFSQVTHAGEEGQFPMAVGAGASGFSLDWGHDALGSRRPIFGGTLWIDWTFIGLPRYLSGIGIEAEARDVSKFGPVELSKGYNDYPPGCAAGTSTPCGPNPSGLREDTAEGGAIYSWRRYQKIHPYAKFLVGFGSIDFPAGDAYNANGSPYTHDTRTIYSLGGGGEYRVNRKVTIRADYEYQYWTHFLGHVHTLNPNGISIGATYALTPYHHHLRLPTP